VAEPSVRRRALVGALLLVLAAACVRGGGSQTKASVAMHRIRTPEGTLFGTAPCSQDTATPPPKASTVSSNSSTEQLSA